MIWTNIKLYFFAAMGAVMAGLVVWGKAMSNKAEKYEQKAKEKTREAESATEISNTYSELNRVDKKAGERKNEVLKNRDTSKPVAC